jgi:dCTP deaminase
MLMPWPKSVKFLESPVVLNDEGIRYLGERGHIDPYDPKRVQPASIDLTLAGEFKLYHTPFDALWKARARHVVDLRNVDTAMFLTPFTLETGQVFQLEPGAFCLARTAEKVTIPDNLVARVEGKSSLGRLGLVVHATAGFCDPGFCGTITLELYNMNPNPLIIAPDLAICQLSFMQMTAPAVRPYGHPDLGSHYQGQESTTESRYEG